MKIFCILLLFLGFATANAQSKISYSGYENSRYLYTFSYPSSLLTQQPESENGDGAKFTNKQGKERIRCWGRLNLDVEGNKLSLKQRNTLDEAFFKEEKAKITYKRCTNVFGVLSGKYKNGTNFYQKMIAKPDEDAFAYILITYPDTEKKLWEPLIAKITGSLK